MTIQYVTDSEGRPLYVQVPLKDFEKLLADSEELEEIGAYKKAKKNPGKLIPFDEAFNEIESHQRKQSSR